MLDFSQLNVVLLVVGATLLVLGITSGLIKNAWHVSETAVALIAGVVAGPAVLGWIDVEPGHGALMETARVTLAIALIGVSLSLPRGYFRRRWREVTVMLAIVLPAMCAASGLMAWGMLGVSPLVGWMIGASIAPTDPVVASAIVTGRIAERRIPGELRQLLEAEAGANDALAYPFVMAPILLFEHSTGEAAEKWFVETLLREIVLAAAIGVAAGYAAGWLLRWALRQRLSERASLITVIVSLSMALLGGVKLLHSDGLFAVFIGGVVFSRFARESLEEQTALFHEAFRRFFDLPVFILLGLMLPWEAWGRMIGGEAVWGGWGAFVFVVLVLLFRRLPAVVAVSPLLRCIRRWPERLFAGWFGPIGIAAIFYALLVETETGDATAWNYASLVVVASVLVHGLTATFAAARFPMGAHQLHFAWVSRKERL